MFRHPYVDCLETGHEPAGRPDADQHAAETQAPFAGGIGKQHRTKRADTQKDGLHFSRSEPVQQQPERDLEAGKPDQISGGQQAELACVQPDIRHQVRRNDGVDRAVQVGQEIAQ